MSLKVPYASSLFFADTVRIGLLDGASLCIFKNDYTPINTTVLADLTEANFDGYARITLDSWTSAFLNADNKAEVDETTRTFTVSGVSTPNTVYGAFVLDGSGNLLYAERDPAGGHLLNTVGQTWSYFPRFTFRSEF